VIGVALAACAGALGMGFALRASSRIARLAPPDAELVESGLRSADQDRVVSAIRDAFADAAPAMENALTAQSAATMNEAAAALDEHLGDLERELSEGRAVAASAARVALLSAGLGAILELLPDLSRAAIPRALGAVTIGVFAAGTCFELGRKSVQRSRDLRSVWDRLAGAAADRLGIPVGTASPGPRDSHRHRHRRGAGSVHRRRQAP
jgi:hypothetical protein